jgi:hypothetical protein
MNIELKSPVAVVANDAGAANIILGWLKESPELEIKFCVDGPAKKIFTKEFPGMKNYTLEKVLENSSVLLSGTGGNTDLEYNARIRAKKKTIPSIGVVDHWVNYHIRFERNDEQVLPNEIWVTDEYAYSKAIKCFPETSVRLMPNSYLMQLVSKINEKMITEDSDDCIRVLYVLEPIRDVWRNSQVPGEFQALDYFVENLNLISRDKEVKIILRAHPSNENGKYIEWCNSNNDLNVTIDTESELPDLIAWADWVVGCETFAMIVALYANKKILSTLPPWASECKLPHKEILQLRDLKNEIL